VLQKNNELKKIAILIDDYTLIFIFRDPTGNGFFNFIQFGNNIAKSLSVVIVLRDRFKSIVPKYGRQKDL